MSLRGHSGPVSFNTSLTTLPTTLFPELLKYISYLIFVGEGSAVDVWSVAAALDVDEQGRVRHDFPLLVVEARQVHPSPDILRGEAVGPRFPGIEYSHLEIKRRLFWYSTGHTQ